MKGGTGRFGRPAFFFSLLLAAAAPASASPVALALSKARELRLAEDPRWLRLGHWKPRLFGRGAVADALPEGFFLSPRGATDPAAELEAMIAALFEGGGPEPQPARCRFPLRTEWLLARLGLEPASLPRADCSRFEDWLRLLDPGSVSLIFASAYLDNPASMFGHTFLRFERRAVGEGERLLDNTLNFAAEPGGDGALFFTFKGLMGLYPGKYTVQPYYMMVQRYNNIESRDLWEYRLALTPAETRALAAHAWELGSAVFPYYFLSKNCSYQLMPALEAVMPDRTLMPGSLATVAPVDTVRAVLASPGLVAAVQFRPSHSTAMLERRALLSPGERRAADAYRRGSAAEGDGLASEAPPERRALILDAAHDYVLYKEGYSPDVPEKVRTLERSILTRRAKLDVPDSGSAPKGAVSPDAGHRRGRLQLGGGARSGGSFAELAWRPGYHDLLDRPDGYAPGAAIEAFSWRLRYDGGERRVYVRDLRAVEVLSVTPWDSWTRRPSWTAGTGLDTAFELGKPAADSLVYEGHAGMGLAASLGPQASAWTLAVAEGAAGAALREGWRAGGSLRAAVAADLGAGWRALLDGALSGQPFGDRTPNHRLRAGLNWAPSRDHAVRAEFLLRGPHREGGLYAVLYH